MCAGNSRVGRIGVDDNSRKLNLIDMVGLICGGSSSVLTWFLRPINARVAWEKKWLRKTNWQYS